MTRCVATQAYSKERKSHWKISANSRFKSSRCAAKCRKNPRKKKCSSNHSQIRFKAISTLSKKRKHGQKNSYLSPMMILLYVCAYIPNLYINLALPFGHLSLIPGLFLNASLYLYIIHSIINPIFCILLKEDYKIAFYRVISKGSQPTPGKRLCLQTTSTAGSRI